LTQQDGQKDAIECMYDFNKAEKIWSNMSTANIANNLGNHLLNRKYIKKYKVVGSVELTIKRK